MNRIAKRLICADITTLSLDSLPPNVVQAAAIALDKQPAIAGQIEDGCVILGNSASYADDTHVKIWFDTTEEHNITRIMKVHPFSGAADEDVTEMVLTQMQNS